jgi:hypothetical protein
MLNSIYREMESVVRKNQECIEFLQFIIKPSVNVKEIQSSMVFDKMAFAAIGYAVESIKGAIDMLKTIIDES